MSHLKLYNMRNVQCIHPLYGYVKNLNASYFRFRWICRTDIMHLSSIVLLKIRYPHYNAIFVQYNSYDANTVPFVSMNSMCIAFNSCYILYIQKFCN